MIKVQKVAKFTVYFTFPASQNTYLNKLQNTKKASKKNFRGLLFLRQLTTNLFYSN